MNSKSRKEAERLSIENLRLKSAVEELSVLNDIATAIASTQSLSQVTSLIVKKCVKHLKAGQGTIHLVDEKDFVHPLHTMIRIREDSGIHDPLRFDRQLTEWMLSGKKPLKLNEFKYDEEITLENEQTVKIKSLLSVPMIIKGKLIGILSLFNKEGNAGFSDDDQRLLSIIAGQSAGVIENSRLFEEEIKLQSIRQEIHIAGEIQKFLLPKEVSQTEGYQIYGVNIPAQEVGGDYYDFIKISDTKTAFALGDVSGKGLPASMLMANLQATLRSQLLFSSSVKDCVSRANKLLHDSTSLKRFVTLFFAILDSEKNTVTYCNAGHNIPVFLRGDEQVNLDRGGIILSWKEQAEYIEEEVPFEKGSVLVLYSDGITEALNASGEMYGEEKLLRIVKENRNLSMPDLGEKILKDVKDFSSGLPQSDDMTLVIIKRN